MPSESDANEDNNDPAKPKKKKLSREQIAYLKMYKERMNLITQKTANYSLRQKMCFILSSGGYMAVMVTLTALYLIISGIQYWITDYVISVLGHTK